MNADCVESYSSIGLSLTYDHRAIDGAPASRFAQDLCRRLEGMSTLLAL
jgi:pyruvate dehydrogenase E2 component (dihydrolipoamide acetyltransferase)